MIPVVMRSMAPPPLELPQNGAGDGFDKVPVLEPGRRLGGTAGPGRSSRAFELGRPFPTDDLS